MLNISQSKRGQKEEAKKKGKPGMQSTEGGRPVPPFPSSPFLVGYVVVDTTKRSQESARRRGRKGGA